MLKLKGIRSVFILWPLQGRFTRVMFFKFYMSNAMQSKCINKYVRNAVYLYNNNNNIARGDIKIALSAVFSVV